MSGLAFIAARFEIRATASLGGHFHVVLHGINSSGVCVFNDVVAPFIMVRLAPTRLVRKNAWKLPSRNMVSDTTQKNNLSLSTRYNQVNFISLTIRISISFICEKQRYFLEKIHNPARREALGS